MVVEAKKSDGPPTASVTQVDLAAFASRAARTPDVLERLAGVDVLAYGEGQGSFVRLRGSTAAQVLVLVDGVRMNPISGGGADLDSIPIELLDRVEVIRGAGASRWGADAIGGVVSFRTDAVARRTGARLTAGTHGGLRTAAWTMARARGWTTDLALREGTSPDRWRYSDDLRGETLTRENAGSASLGGSFGARGSVSGGDLAFRAWGTTLRAGAPGLSEQPTPRARRLEERVMAMLRWERDGVALDASQRLEAMRYRNPDPLFGNDPIRTSVRGAASSASIVARQSPTELTRITTGADVRHESIEDRDAGHRERLAAGAHGEFWRRSRSGRAEAMLALRLDGLGGEAGLEWTPLPSIGAALHPSSSWTIRAHAGRGYRVPTFLELWLPNMETVGGNPDLEPEDAWNGDAGVVWNTGALALEAGVFATRLRESIFFAPVSPYRFAPVNGGPSTLAGTELSASAELPRSIGLSLTWTHLESRRDATGEPLPGRPRDRVSARAEWRAMRGLDAFADATWSSGAYADFFGNLEVPAGETLGFGLTAEPTPSLAFTLETTNFTDSTVRDARYFPQPGRTFWLTVSWKHVQGEKT